MPDDLTFDYSLAIETLELMESHRIHDTDEFIEPSEEELTLIYTNLETLGLIDPEVTLEGFKRKVVNYKDSLIKYIRLLVNKIIDQILGFFGMTRQLGNYDTIEEVYNNNTKKHKSHGNITLRSAVGSQDLESYFHDCKVRMVTSKVTGKATLLAGKQQLPSELIDCVDMSAVKTKLHVPLNGKPLLEFVSGGNVDLPTFDLYTALVPTASISSLEKLYVDLSNLIGSREGTIFEILTDIEEELSVTQSLDVLSEYKETILSLSKSIVDDVAKIGSRKITLKDGFYDKHSLDLISKSSVFVRMVPEYVNAIRPLLNAFTKTFKQHDNTLASGSKTVTGELSEYNKMVVNTEILRYQLGVNKVMLGDKSIIAHVEEEETLVRKQILMLSILVRCSDPRNRSQALSMAGISPDSQGEVFSQTEVKAMMVMMNHLSIMLRRRPQQLRDFHEVIKGFIHNTMALVVDSSVQDNVNVDELFNKIEVYTKKVKPPEITQ